MSFNDTQLVCRECGSNFVFTAADQEAFAQRGHSYFPSRCPTCLATRRARNPNGAATHASHAGHGREQRQLYPAICAECGQATQVPFQPRTEKPIYCSDCFSRRQRSGAARA